MPADLIWIAVGGAGVVTWAAGVVWAVRSPAPQPLRPVEDVGLDELMAVADAAGVVRDEDNTTDLSRLADAGFRSLWSQYADAFERQFSVPADVIHGHDCGVECDDVRLDALALVYGPAFARQLAHIDAARYADLYLVPDGAA